MAVYLEGQLQVDITPRYRISSTQNEGGLARLPVRHPLRALDGGLTGGCFGNSSILGGHSSKADSYHSLKVLSLDMISNRLRVSLAATVIVGVAIAGLWGLTGGAGALHRVPGDYAASPVLVDWAGQTSIAVATKKGWVAAIEPGTGRARWSLDLAAPAGEEAFLLATPAHVDGHLVIAYQTDKGSSLLLAL